MSGLAVIQDIDQLLEYINQPARDFHQLWSDIDQLLPEINQHSQYINQTLANPGIFPTDNE
ncbi:hypothetical protein [Mesobacillus zeae]|uniref:Uncharacterized protein n=1 Tax=Mesobacillus zeae TaxID=1917180 RepID=A0A398BA21_9BACI|nr:hypothetical protein [Mesobacillus zeae]RID86845.1 hypothetical protein D1970_06230 [Mesobacillus zeae]